MNGSDLEREGVASAGVVRSACHYIYIYFCGMLVCYCAFNKQSTTAEIRGRKHSKNKGNWGGGEKCDHSQMVLFKKGLKGSVLALHN